ncbi:hypothetical protein Tco_0711503 [Tanacetum coccineum]
MHVGDEQSERFECQQASSNSASQYDLPMEIVTNDSPLFPCVASTYSRTTRPESGWEIQVVAVDRLWEHIPIVGLMVAENKRCGERWIGNNVMDSGIERETLGECVDEIDKLAELIGAKRSFISSLSSPKDLLHTKLDSQEHRFQLEGLGEMMFMFDVTNQLEWLQRESVSTFSLSFVTTILL